MDLEPAHAEAEAGPDPQRENMRRLVSAPLAAGVLYPFFGWLLDPMYAAAAISLSSVCVIGNALRLARTTL